MNYPCRPAITLLFVWPPFPLRPVNNPYYNHATSRTFGKIPKGLNLNSPGCNPGLQNCLENSTPEGLNVDLGINPFIHPSGPCGCGSAALGSSVFIRVHPWLNNSAPGSVFSACRAIALAAAGASVVKLLSRQFT